MLHKAIVLSSQYYKDLFCKDKKTLLITHTYETAMILLEHGFKDTAILGCLHECAFLKSFNVQLETSITKNFTKNINESLKMYFAKLNYIQENFYKEHFSASSLSQEEMLLMCADHISYLRHLNYEYETKGITIYEDFNGERLVSMYFGEILSLLLPLSKKSIYWELSYQYKKLFIRIYKHKYREILIKTNGFKSFILAKNNPFWQRHEMDTSELRNDNIYQEIIPKDALILEAEWSAREDNFDKIVNELLDRLEQEEIRRHVKILTEQPE